MKGSADTGKSISGILLVNKPAGITSHDAVDYVRRILKIRKVGHTGTLDPQAVGLLVMCIGGATRFSSYLLKQDKTYHAEIKLGESTTTDDIEGEISYRYEGDLDALLASMRLEDILQEFVGVNTQMPPVFSSKKINGVPAYELARRGIKPELKPVEVCIYSIRLLNADFPLLEIELDCSSGTYLRALARDLGERIGCGGHLTSLERTRIGKFTVEMACSLEQLKKLDRNSIAEQFVIPVEEALDWLPRLELPESSVEKIYLGGQVEINRDFKLKDNESCDQGPQEVRIYDKQQTFLGIGLLEKPGDTCEVLRPKRLMMEAFGLG